MTRVTICGYTIAADSNNVLEAVRNELRAAFASEVA